MGQYNIYSYTHTHTLTHRITTTCSVIILCFLYTIHIYSTNKKKKLLFGYRQFVFNCWNFGNLASIHILYSDNCTTIQDNK